ncbi:hypothetical protein [Magnetovibrio blakemorei]|uniref:hypothetical protein n=1 Tax=Magnetovibrio blakemorei TaxID=28181 RepID=UPI001112EE98|nr:hypothetical protein [Magnetovibrio blakemorei]
MQYRNERANTPQEVLPPPLGVPPRTTKQPLAKPRHLTACPSSHILIRIVNEKIFAVLSIHYDKSKWEISCAAQKRKSASSPNAVFGLNKFVSPQRFFSGVGSKIGGRAKISFLIASLGCVNHKQTTLSTRTKGYRFTLKTKSVWPLHQNATVAI